ncbi:unnamed protein product [Microthlaspi erraticum]|uniref:Uncharacterized protein n=1 Tax=Microthlaspi erraticum TaxID=1685480 RepID=A0A6D2J077_9BRAS|nr:unnamed protein product [Microthlaspi erraticum]
MGQGAWRDLAHGSSSTGYAKEEGRSHLEDQLDRPLDQPVEFLNSTGQASTRSSWKSKRLQVGCFKVGKKFLLGLQGDSFGGLSQKVVVLEGLTSLVRPRGLFEVVCGEVGSPL